MNSSNDSQHLAPNLSVTELQTMLDARLAMLSEPERVQLTDALEGLAEIRWMTAVRQILSMSLDSNSAAYGIKDPHEPDPGPMNPNPLRPAQPFDPK